jgi:hypothetical protein
MSEIQAERTPASLSEVIADLRGFGIEEFEEILTLEIGGKQVRLKLANVPTDQDLTAMLAVEGTKGYVFFQEIKVELLSRSITWINGVDLRKLEGKDRLVVDPKDGFPKDIQVILRDTIKGWGIEIMQVLWKVLMVHSQTIENRLFEKFPDAAVLTDVERRYREHIEREMEEMTKDAIQERVANLLDGEEETAS